MDQKNHNPFIETPAEIHYCQNENCQQPFIFKGVSEHGDLCPTCIDYCEWCYSQLDEQLLLNQTDHEQ